MLAQVVLVLIGCGGDQDALPADTGTLSGFTGTQVLVMPVTTGLELRDLDGSLVFSRTWSELVGSCGQCGGEGASADGDGLLLSFTTDGNRNGGIARLDASAALDFRTDGFAFPHDAVRDPADGTVLVAESTGDTLRWIDEDGATVRTLSGSVPNGLDRFDWAGRSLLLVSHRGAGGGPGGPGAPSSEPAGAISLWDITVPGDPVELWTFPEQGALAVPHGPVFREHGGQLWLLWAHTEGATDGGSVGVAVTDDPTVRPTWVADLVPPANIAPLTFLRGVELTADGWLYLTDSGQGLASTGRLIRAPFPTGLQPAGGFLELEDAEVLAANLANPFEGWLWTPAWDL